MFDDVSKVSLRLRMLVRFLTCLETESLLLHFSEIKESMLDKGIIWLEAFVEFLRVLVLPLLIVEALVLAGSLFKILVLFSHLVNHRN